LISSIDDLHFIGFSNTVFDETTHYITLIYSVNVYSGDLKIMEENKCEKWEWFDVNDLPKNLFKPFENYLIDNNL
jgi:8-oxo-dGTP diphosphatase